MEYRKHAQQGFHRTILTEKQGFLSEAGGPRQHARPRHGLNGQLRKYRRINRPRHFDIDSLRNCVTEVFVWHGYHGTSMRMLTDASGLGTQSLHRRPEIRLTAARRGNIGTPGISDPPSPGLTGPLLDCHHSFGASITRGYGVRGAHSALIGRYAFAGFVSGRALSIAADSSVQTQRADPWRRHRADRAAGRRPGWRHRQRAVLRQGCRRRSVRRGFYASRQG